MNEATHAYARLSGIYRNYGTTIALEDVDLSLASGEVLALLGANGAGKSTAIALLLGLLRPDAGVATLFGGDPNTADARRRIGVMLQSAGIPENSLVRELLDVTRSYYPSPRSVADCIEMAGLEGLMHRRYGKLSGGQQRRVQFALAICGNPELLFLDEPTTGLDIDVRQRMWATIRALVAAGTGVLLTTHYLEEAEALADRVTVLNRGRVVATGTMDEVRARVSQRRIRCRTSLDPASVAAWPEVSEVTLDEGRMEVATDAPEQVLRRMLVEDAALRDLEVVRAGLADAFLKLTGADERADDRVVVSTTQEAA